MTRVFSWQNSVSLCPTSFCTPRPVQFSPVTLSCPTLCDPMHYTVHGILQARILEWIAFPFSRGSPNPGIEPRSPALQADSLPAEPSGKPMVTSSVHCSVTSNSLLPHGLQHARPPCPSPTPGVYSHSCPSSW